MIIAGWALAQEPVFLPALTVRQAAAPHDTLVLVVIAVLAGGAILFASLATLFELVLRGDFDPGAPAAAPIPEAMMAASPSAPLARVALALIGGVGGLTLAGTRWAHVVGVVCLLGFVVVGFVAVAPAQIAAGDDP